MNRGTRQLLAAAMTLFVMASLAQAATCDNAKSAQDVESCLASDLFAADENLNLTYGSLMGSLSEADKGKLRSSQRAWIKERNEVCRVDDREQNRRKWHEALTRDHKKALCVARYSKARTLELESMLARQGFKATAAAHQQQDYQLVTGVERSSGRWYFEVLLKSEDISRVGPAVVWIGCRESKFDTGVGVTKRIRPGLSSGQSMIGIAIDLEHGKFYHRVDGTWQNGQPGTSGGLDVKLGRDYACGIDSTELVKPLQDREQLDVNFGERPLYYAAPDGYQPWRGAAQWIVAGTTGDGKRVMFDYSSINLTGARPSIQALQENPNTSSVPQTTRKIKALQTELIANCQSGTFDSGKSYYVGEDFTYVAHAMFPFKLEQSSGSGNAGGSLVRTLCTIQQLEFVPPDLSPGGRAWEELASPVDGVRIFEAMDRRQSRNGMFVLVNKNETVAPVEFAGKPSRVLVAASVLDCRELIIRRLISVRFDERSRLLGGSFFDDSNSFPRLPVNRMRLINACAVAFPDLKRR